MLNKFRTTIVSLLAINIVLAVLVSGCTSTPVSSVMPPTPKIAIQLWSVKDPLAQDFDGTIAQLAQLGFDGVELAGYFGPYQENLSGLLTLLEKHNLSISSAHLPIAQLSSENIIGTIKKYQILGVNKIILPWDDRAFDSIKFKPFVADLQRIQSTLAQHNIQFGFHNHEHEFNDYKNSTYWDQLALSTDEKFILQLDIGWVTRAGKDPVSYIKRYPNRMKLTHFKAKLLKPIDGKYPIIGQDTTDWPQVLEASITNGGVQWIIIEQEEYPMGLTPMQSVAKSKLALDKMISAR